MEKQKMPERRNLVEGLTVHGGHFWVRVDSILSPGRKAELKAEAGKVETLRVVGDSLWARIENPHPTVRQRELLEGKIAA